MQETYETIFILQPELTEEEVDGNIATFEGVLKDRQAQLVKTEKWGKKRLAYRVRRFWEGFYVLLEYTSTADTLHELERRLRIHDNVIKWMSVKKDPRAAAEEERRAARLARAQAMRPEDEDDDDMPPMREHRERRSHDSRPRPPARGPAPEGARSAIAAVPFTPVVAENDEEDES